jgi:AcrR family transcriptional regulator
MEERLANNRDRILLATRKLVAEGGFREAQIAAVAALAGMSTGMIYRYFPSKAELFVEVLGVAVEEEIKILADIADGPESAERTAEHRGDLLRPPRLAGPNLAYALSSSRSIRKWTPLESGIGRSLAMCSRPF